MGLEIFYIPNVLSYIRIVLLILAIITIKKRPILMLVFVLLSGLIDEFDGTISRTLNQTSQFGALLDKGIDRFTSSLQLFFLSASYPNYYYIFLNIQFFEYFNDYLAVETESYHNIYSNKISNDQDEFYMANFIDRLLPLIWYTSDMFYWLLYFGTFVEKRLISSNEKNKSLKSIKTLPIKFKYYINDCIMDLSALFEDIFQSLRDYGPHFIHSNFNTKFIFKSFCTVCLIGSILKFYLHLKSVLEYLNLLITHNVN